MLVRVRRRWSRRGGLEVWERRGFDDIGRDAICDGNECGVDRRDMLDLCMEYGIPGDA